MRLYVWSHSTSNSEYFWYLSPGATTLRTFRPASGEIATDPSWAGDRERIIRNMNESWKVVPDNEIPPELLAILEPRRCVPEGL